jgi:hypothetical protein
MNSLNIVECEHACYVHLINATETKCLEQVKDVAILEKEDKCISPMSRLFREVQYLSLSPTNLGEA